MNRKYKSLYFSDKRNDACSKGDFTIAFSEKDPLYKKCKDLSSTEIKNILGIHSYEELKLKAKKENRSTNNYIKNILKKKL